MGTPVADSREELLIEELQYRASISEATAQKIAASVNFVNNRQFDKHSWNLNGDFSLVQASEVGDGVFICQEDMEIVGYSLFIGTNGTSGTAITCDLHKIQYDGTDDDSIFSTKPSIDDTADDETFTHSNIRVDEHLVPTGHTKGVFNTTEFDRGDALRFDLDESLGGAEDLQLTIYFRSR